VQAHFEPFRIKSVEPIRRTTRDERETLLAKAHFNLFRLASRDVMIDLLTDSGTSAMSADQWAAMMQADESYAGADSFYRFEEAVQDITGFKHIIPTHQGRAAEGILAGLFGGLGRVTLNNTHFDTTRANLEVSGATAVDLNISEGQDPTNEHPFKGNMDLKRLKSELATRGGSISLVMMTLTNNAGGGQPVSLENLRAVAAIARKFGKPFFIDGCRFAENAYFIKTREPGQENRTIKSIVQEVFSLADGMTMSAKKDALVNIGGWIAMHDDGLAAEARSRLILTEGFPTYGGLAGRDLEAMAVGIREVLDEDYLAYRIKTTAWFGQQLADAGIPVVRPFGGHAIFLDAKAMFPHIEPLAFPGQVLATAFYLEGGVRSVELGSVMWGRQVDGSEAPAPMELVRLALPRRVYTQAHLQYVVEVARKVVETRDRFNGLAIAWEPPTLRHFSAHFKAAA
jgi:tryptophanase